MENIQYRIKSIKILEKALFEIDKKSLDLNIDLNIERKLQVEKDLSIIIIQTNISKKNSHKLFAKVKVAFVFEIKNLSEIAPKNEFPKNLELILISISYSTMRGIIFSEFQGTYLQDFILPIVDPKRLVNNFES